MIAKKVQIEGLRACIEPELFEVIEKKLRKIQAHFCRPIDSIRMVLVGSGHHRKGAFEVHLVASSPGHVISITKKGKRTHPLVEHAFDVLDQTIMRHLRAYTLQN